MEAIGRVGNEGRGRGREGARGGVGRRPEEARRWRSYPLGGVGEVVQRRRAPVPPDHGAVGGTGRGEGGVRGNGGVADPDGPVGLAGCWLAGPESFPFLLLSVCLFLFYLFLLYYFILV